MYINVACDTLHVNEGMLITCDSARDSHSRLLLVQPRISPLDRSLPIPGDVLVR